MVALTPVLLGAVPMPAEVTSVFIRGVDLDGSRAVFAGQLQGSSFTDGIGVIDLTDDWALRELTIVVRAEAELRPYARQLVENLRA